MKLNDVIQEKKFKLLFLYKGDLFKLKWQNQNNNSWFCSKINYQYYGSSLINTIPNSYLDSKLVEININSEITLWNEPDLKLDIFLFYYKTIVYFNPMKEEFYLFPDSFTLEQHLKYWKGDYENKFYLGTTKLAINNGVIVNDTFKPTNQVNDLEKILFLSLNHLYEKKDIKIMKKRISNLKYFQNSLFDFINDFTKIMEILKPKFYDLSHSFIFEISNLFKRIKFSYYNSDFYGCLSILRNFRNLIISVLFEKVFIEKNRFILKEQEINNMLTELKLKWDIEAINSKKYFEKNSWLHIDSKDKNIYCVVEEVVTKIKKNKKPNNQNVDELNKIKKKLEIWMICKAYYSTPLDFSNIKFENLVNKNINLYIEPALIHSNINNLNIFKTDEEKSYYETANKLANNSIHKSNYDTENFEGWIINDNELDILMKVTKIYCLMILNYFLLEYKNCNDIIQFKKEHYQFIYK